MSPPGNTDPATLRAYLARILGWSAEQAVESALRSIDLSIAHRAALVLLGVTDPVSIAQALHRRTIGADRPFVICDQRQNMSGLAAARAARGGSLCVRRRRLPHDFPSVVALLREPHASTQIIVCAEAQHDSHPFLIRPIPIRIPPLSARTGELPRIVAEYAHDATTTLGVDDGGFTEADRTWILDHAAATLADIETATMRRVALRMSRTITEAARRLGMSSVALHQWIERRGLRRDTGGES